MRYWAFLSYSHTDAKWGDWLHNALETYRVPRRLVGQESHDGRIPARLFPIFRDREELPVSADLPSNINEALHDSRYLIVICSPRAAQSRWVGEEIKAFKKLGREDRILAMIVAGEPNASDGKSGFVLADECFPEPMRYRMGTEGQLSTERTQPLAADAREGKDGKNNAKLRLLAGLLGVNYDELKQREQERRIRRARAIAFGALVLVSIFAALAIALFFKEREARTQQIAAENARGEARVQQVAAEQSRDQARATSSKSDFLQALRSIDEDRYFEALAQLSRSLRLDPHNHAALSRLETLLVYRSYAALVLTVQGARPRFSRDGKRIITVSSDGVLIWDAETGRHLAGPIAHPGITSAQFSPDGSRILTASGSLGAPGEARIWDAQTGKPLSKPIKHTDTVQSPDMRNVISSAQFSPDGKWIVTVALAECEARVWDAQTGSGVGEPMRHNGLVASAQFSPDSKRILTTVTPNIGASAEPQLWDAQTGKRLPWQTRSNNIVYSAQFSPDGKRIVTASSDKTVQIRDAETGRQLTEPMMHSSRVISARFSPDGERIVTASGEIGKALGQVCIWDAKTGKLLINPITCGAQAESAQFSQDGKRVVAEVLLAVGKTAVCVWDGHSGKPLTDLISGISSPEFNVDGKRIIAESEHGARVWDVTPGKALGKSIKDESSVSLVVFSPDGKLIATVCGNRDAKSSGNARVWNAETGKPLSVSLKHQGFICSVQFSPDCKRILTGSWDSTARVWDVQTGKSLTDPIKHDESVNWALFSPNGKRIVTASANQARVWDAQTGNPVTEPMKHSHVVLSARFAPDGGRLVTASGSAEGDENEEGVEGEARVWDAQTGKQLTKPMKQDAGLDSAQFTLDGKRIVTASYGAEARMGSERVWDAQSGDPVTDWLKHDELDWPAQLSPDGNLSVTASRFGDLPGVVRVWEIATRKQLTEPMKPKSTVFSAQFNQDGNLIATTGPNVTIWDVQTGKSLAEFLPNRNTAMQFSPDGKRIATVSDQEVQIWDIAPSGTSCPEWLPRLADAIAGQYLNDNGVFQPLDKDVSEVLEEIKRSLNKQPVDDNWAIVGRWFLANRLTRTISPFSKITVPEYVENRIKENTAESLDEAEGLVIGNAELQGRIAAARASLPKSQR